MVDMFVNAFCLLFLIVAFTMYLQFGCNLSQATYLCCMFINGLLFLWLPIFL